MKECFRAKGRQLFVDRDDPDVTTLVFNLENGELINTATLKPFTPGARWRLEESHNDPAVFTFLGKWSNKWGDECIAMFGSAQEAETFAAANDIGHWILQRVRVIENG
jgi:hypothetical protein